MAAQIATIGLVFGLIFKVELEDYFPFLATSIVLWTFISSSILEGAQSLIAAEPMIRQLKLPALTYVVRVTWRNILTFLHNAIILPIVFVVFSVEPNWNLALVIPAFLVLAATMIFLSYLTAVASARFRDVPPILNSALMVAFYVTPVMWQAKQIDDQLGHFLIGLNPLYHLVQIVRLPLLGEMPTVENWVGSLVAMFVCFIVYLLIRTYVQKRIAYWV